MVAATSGRAGVQITELGSVSGLPTKAWRTQHSVTGRPGVWGRLPLTPHGTTGMSTCSSVSSCSPTAMRTEQAHGGRTLLHGPCPPGLPVLGGQGLRAACSFPCSPDQIGTFTLQTESYCPSSSLPLSGDTLQFFPHPSPLFLKDTLTFSGCADFRPLLVPVRVGLTLPWQQGRVFNN